MRLCARGGSGGKAILRVNTQTFWGRLVHALTLILWMLSGFMLADNLTAPEGDHNQDTAQIQYEALPLTAGKPRAFVLIVDSLRDKTATDPNVMPYLSQMQGLRTRILSSRDAITVSALRAMFTGREWFTIFGFVKNFTHGREQLESLFTQWRAAGVSVSVYSDGSLQQFAEDIPDTRDYPHLPGDERDYQDDIMRRALTDYLSGEHQVVVAHITYSDHAAHEHGVGTPEYVDAFKRVDRLIAEFDAAIASDETFVVAGDHGHTDDGRHALGLDIPTFTVYRGPRFAQTTLPDVLSIRTHRCLLSWATNQKPVSGCESAALLGAMPDASKLLGDEHTQTQMFGAAISGGEENKKNTTQAMLVVVGVCGLVALWGVMFGGVWGFWREHKRAAAVTLWGGLCGMLLGGAVWGWVGIFVGAVWSCVGFGFLLGRRDLVTQAHIKRLGLWVGLGGVGAWAWGHALALGRAWVHEPSTVWMFRLWFVVIVGVGVWAVAKKRVAWWALGLPLLLLYPTVYGYGALPGLANVGLAWVLAVGLIGYAGGWRGALLGGGIALCWQPFGVSEGFNFTFYHWYPWVERLVPGGWYEWQLAALLGRAVLLVDTKAPRWVQALSVFAAAGLGVASWKGTALSPAWMLGLISVCALGFWVLTRWAKGRLGANKSDAVVALANVLGMGALMLAFYHFVRVPEVMYRQGECMLAGLVLGAYFVRRSGASAQMLDKHNVFLHLMALGFAGWMTLSWTFQSLEWLQSYDWFEAVFVESNVILFVPLIVLKYALPVVIVRQPLRAVLGPPNHPLLWSAVMVKAGVLLLVTLGIAAHLPNTGVYLESIQETSIFVILCLGLL